MRIVCLLLFVLSTTTSYAQPRRISVESTISAVRVFASGAQILRTASAAILPGRTEVIFSGLSNQLEQQSLQGKADVNITLLSVQAIKDFGSQRKLEADEQLARI